MYIYKRTHTQSLPKSSHLLGSTQQTQDKDEKEIEAALAKLTKKFTGEDLFVEREDDPKRCNALASSLWEVKVCNVE